MPLGPPQIQTCIAIGAALSLGTCHLQPRFTRLDNPRCIHKPYLPQPLGRLWAKRGPSA